jgi:hypothetical protein
MEAPALTPRQHHAEDVRSLRHFPFMVPDRRQKMKGISYGAGRAFCAARS